MTYLKNFMRDEEGQDMVEYALLLGFIALAVVAVMTTTGSDIASMYSKVNGSITTATGKIS
jgi:pilus assembly protein Flp/PilA